MSGAYAHITLVNELIEPRRLAKFVGMPIAAKKAVGMNLKYCELGAVSPDYPYLNLFSSEAKKWADLMHSSQTWEVIREGIRGLQRVNGTAHDRILSWLLGYVAHVVTDCTIHPIVQLIGDYEKDPEKHRICELHQDAYIYRRLSLGPDIGLSEHLDTGIADCVGSGERGDLDLDLQTFWQDTLNIVYPGEAAKNPPKVDKWHRWFVMSLDKFAEEGNHFPVLVRHLIAEKGATYPDPNKLDHQYLYKLNTPTGPMDYDEIFDKAIENVGRIWEAVADAACGNNEASLTCIADWNPDTGRDENDRYGFW